MTESDFKPKGHLWLLIILVLVGFVLSVIYFSRRNPDLINAAASITNKPSARQPRVYTVFYGLGVFSPTNIRIHVGDSVRFQNDGNAPLRVVSDSVNGVVDLAGFDSIGDIQPGGVFSYTFIQAGTFGYHNSHDPAEEGAVIVRP